MQKASDCARCLLEGFSPGRHAEGSWEIFEGRGPGHAVLWGYRDGNFARRSRVMTTEAAAARVLVPHIREKELLELGAA